jgi:uncharacterized membrane protein
MVEIHGLDPLGAFHAALGLLAVTLGLMAMAVRKGTATHRRAGLLYVVVMVLLNATALMIYDLFGRFGPFHVLALVLGGMRERVAAVGGNVALDGSRGMTVTVSLPLP